MPSKQEGSTEVQIWPLDIKYKHQWNKSVNTLLNGETKLLIKYKGKWKRQGHKDGNLCEAYNFKHKQEIYLNITFHSSVKEHT